MKRLFHHPFIRRHASQLWKFAISGGIGAFIDLTSLAFFIERFGMDGRIAAIPSTLLAVTFVFLSNKFFTFRNKEPAAGQVMKFALVYGIAVVLNIVMTNIFIWLGTRIFGRYFDEVWIAVAAKALAIGFGAVWNYTLSHGYIFRKQKEVEPTFV